VDALLTEVQVGFHRMRAAGVELRADGDRLAIKAPAPLTDEQRGWVREHKAELLDLLTNRMASPTPLSQDDQAAIEEAIEERAAIREFDGGEDRATAEQEASSAMRVYRYRLTDKAESWLTLICPGCDLAEARKSVASKFGQERVLEVVEHRPTPRAAA